MRLRTFILRSSSGAPYLGCMVPDFVASPYIRRLAKRVNRKKLIRMIQNRQRRDGKHHHVTLFAPKEWEASRSRTIRHIKNHYDFETLGLGIAADGLDEAAFIVLECEEANRLRNHVGLSPRDFHVTLGFSEKDIHQRHKNHTSLVERSSEEMERRKFGKLIERFDTKDDIY